MDLNLKKEEGVGLGDVLTLFCLWVKVFIGIVSVGNTTLSLVLDYCHGS
jgi:hypothetical protein